MTKFLLAVDNYIITKTILQLCISILTLFVEDLMKDIDFESIGKKLKEIRLSKGLPQDAVASAAEVNTSHISNIENNRVKVSLPTLIYICNALGVTVDYVLSGEYTGDYSSIDREIMKEIQSLSDEEKERVLRVVRALK
mgnify:CR=1 FL=1